MIPDLRFGHQVKGYYVEKGLDDFIFKRLIVVSPLLLKIITISMENFELEKKDLLGSGTLQIDATAGANWKEAGSWAKAIGIIFIVGIGVMILGTVVFLTVDNSSKVLFDFTDRSYMGILIIFLIIILAVCGLLAVSLLRFGNGINSAVKHMDQSAFEKSIAGLKTYFIVGGSISILGVIYSLFTIL